MGLAKVLSEIRALRGYSLRRVEEATGISNAYLSQLERGDAQKPSPHKLQALAEFYDVPYTELMREAGYLHRKKENSGTKATSASAVQAALMSANLTPEEEGEVVKYIKFLRFENNKKE